MSKFNDGLITGMIAIFILWKLGARNIFLRLVGIFRGDRR